MDTALQKKSLRNVMRDALRQMKAEDVFESSLAAGKIVTEMPEFKKASVIMVYKAFRSECDPAFIVRTALENGKQTAYPVCLPGNVLAACIPFDESCFIRSDYGIMEPDLERSKRIGPEEIDLIIVPGLAFDRSCRRLGRGAGFYDRFLQAVSAYKVGFAHDIQMIENIPSELHDVVMDAAASPSGVVYRG
jgi:5-formyltetrahydrofolate cyclo-ligase